MVALIVGLLLTDSRGGLVALAVMLGAALLLAGHLRARIAAVCGVSVLVGIGYFVLFASDVSVARLVSVVHGGASGRLSDGSGRLPLWRLAIELVSERPLAGVGAGNFRSAAEQHFARDPTLARPPLEVVHNTYLEIQTELGLVGLLLFLTLLGGAVAMLFRALQRAAAIGDRDGSLQARGILVGMTGLLVADLFLSGEYQVQLWWLIGLGIASAGIGLERSGSPGTRQARV
jgi:O-antigen ligase